MKKNILTLTCSLSFALLALPPSTYAQVRNTAYGTGALNPSTTGSDNTAIGYNSLEYVTSGTANTATGSSSLQDDLTGNFNTADGWYSLSGCTGNYNTGIGIATLQDVYGDNNTAAGSFSLNSNFTGHDNTAMGYYSLVSNFNGTNNTANGAYALENNDSGANNTALGGQALFNNLGASNNTGVGVRALLSNTTGHDNIALGVNAGENATTGSSNIFIGNTGVSSDGNLIRLGTTQSNTFIAGISGATAASGVAVYVNGNGQLGTLTSSKRFKQNIQPMNGASDVLYSLHPVTFKYNKELDPQGLSQFGLVAEEVEKVDPNLVAHDDKGQPYTVRYEAVSAMLLNEFLKEHHRIEGENAQVEDLKRQNSDLKNRLDQLEKLVQTLAANR
ncbi:MAG TPA: tail fiber domain-containing protein [Verrucomicrobiae bacterium]|jgi:hypothetical protein|nr:tail fiber domain-containing protein [Verrucomicrobiae bacterium]